MGKYTEALSRWVKGGIDAPSKASTIGNWNALFERTGWDKLLPYRGWDYDHDLILMDRDETVYAGFGLELDPLLIAGRDIEPQLESVITSLPEDSVIQFCQWASPDIKAWMDQWLDARTKDNPYPLLTKMAHTRHEHMLKRVQDRSLLPTDFLHPRIFRTFCFVRVPYTGRTDNPRELDEWIRNVIDVRASVSGKLAGANLRNRNMTNPEMKRLLRQLLNPQFPTHTLDEMNNPDVEFPDGLCARSAHSHVTENGRILFRGGTTDVAAIVMSVDSYPEQLYLPNLRNLIGGITDRDSKIAEPFWAWTTIHVPNPVNARAALQTRLGVISKWTLSESAWIRSMAAPLYQRRDNTQELIDQTKGSRQLVRVATGVTVYASPERAGAVSDYVSSLWRKAGFQLSPETNIPGPVFVSALPMCYAHENDRMTQIGQRGLMRLQMVTSLNAACMAFVGSDWCGLPPQYGGPLFVSRRGQLAAFDLFASNSNYNYTKVATSGAGKSFLSNEIVCDILSRGGVVRIIDVGESYKKLCETIGGQQLRFNPARPQSINPFWGMDEEEDYNEMAPLIKELVAMMAYPLGHHEIPPWEYAMIERTMRSAWLKNRGRTEIRHIYDQLKNDTDRRASDLADQIEAYAVGRYSMWFNGPREVEFSNNFTLLELNDLQADADFRTVILGMMMNLILRDMYMATPEKKNKPKLCLCDEAWKLLSGGNTAAFIESMARTIRKYFGSLGIITQGYADMKMSAAAKAALDNSAWKFNLYQQSTSVAAAKEMHAMPPENEALWTVLGSIKPGLGFSEVYIYHEFGGEAYRFIVDPYSHFTYTTNPKERAAIDALVDNGGLTYEEAITQLAQQRYAQEEAAHQQRLAAHRQIAAAA